MYPARVLSREHAPEQARIIKVAIDAERHTGPRTTRVEVVVEVSMIHDALIRLARLSDAEEAANFVDVFSAGSAPQLRRQLACVTHPFAPCRRLFRHRRLETLAERQLASVSPFLGLESDHVESRSIGAALHPQALRRQKSRTQRQTHRFIHRSTHRQFFCGRPTYPHYKSRFVRRTICSNVVSKEFGDSSASTAFAASRNRLYSWIIRFGFCFSCHVTLWSLPLCPRQHCRERILKSSEPPRGGGGSRSCWHPDRRRSEAAIRTLARA